MFFKMYLVALGVFMLVDFTWIGFVAKNFYREQIGYLLAPNVNWPAAIIFYLRNPRTRSYLRTPTFWFSSQEVASPSLYQLPHIHPLSRTWHHGRLRLS